MMQSTGLTTGIPDAVSVFSKAPVVAAAWMASSALFTTYSTTRFLTYKPTDASSSQIKRHPLAQRLLSIPRPMALTFFRFGGSLALGLLAHLDLRILERLHTTINLAPSFALPAFFLFVANYSNSISLQRVGISLTYTSKCGIPLVTVLLTLLLEGPSALPTVASLLSLIPIALGIGAASWNSPTFEKWGFIAALVSCFAQSGMNLSSKYAMTKLGVAGPTALRSMVLVGLAIVSVPSFLQMLVNKGQSEGEESSSFPPGWLAFAAAAAYHTEYILSFTFSRMVAPITYGACDAVRRLLIIIMGNFMFGAHSFSTINVAGIATALFGALSYSMFNVPKISI